MPKLSSWVKPVLSKRSIPFALPFAVLIAFVAGCGSGNQASTTTPTQPSQPATPAAFAVASITPANGTSQVALTSTIQITFNSAADASTVNTTNIQVTDPKPVSGTVAYDANTDTATFTPSAALPQDSTFTVTVTGVSSSAGTAMSAPFTSNFATVSTTSSPSPGGGTPGSGSAGGTATLQYEATLEGATNGGQVSVDTAGNVLVQLSGAVASTKMTVEFCPINNSQNPPTCMTLGTVTTDSNGDGSFKTMFPKTGSWAGDFKLLSSTATVNSPTYETDIQSKQYDNGQIYMSTLEPMQTVDQGEFAIKGSQAPLTSGTVTWSNGSSTTGSITYALTGTTPNEVFDAVEEDDQIGDSNSYDIGGGTSDANGNLTFTAPQDGSGGDIFTVGPSNGDNGFVGGFSVPDTSAPAIQYLATLGGASGSGLVAVDTAGNTTVMVTGSVASLQFAIEFCPAFNSGDTQPSCIPMGSLTTDAKGNASATMKFPQAGSWAGDFQLTSNQPASASGAGTIGFTTDVTGDNSTQVYMSTLQPITTVNQGIFAGGASKQAPLTTGAVLYANGSLEFVLEGAPANTSVGSSENALGLGSSDSYVLYNSQNQDNFTTDSNGDVSFSVLQDGVFGDLFEVSLNGGDGYLGGFSIPQPSQP